MVDVQGLFGTSDKWKTLPVQCVGGLNTSVDTLSYKPGEATQLLNFEPSLYGGYRRLSGFTKYDTTVVPGSGKVLGVCAFPGSSSQVIACRNDKVYTSTGSGWSASIATRTAAKKYRFIKYVFGGVLKVIMCDGVNRAATWDGTTYTLINGTGAPADPKFATTFYTRTVLAGYSAKPNAISISAPATDTDFNGADGAIELVTSGNITGVRTFRDQLYIFCQHELWKIVSSDGSGTTNSFQLSQVTKDIGTLASDSINEINGNLVYLAPDGIRTVTGSERIGDVGLASISKHILPIANGIIAATGNNPDNISSVLVRGKNQYRLFYSADSDTEMDALGLLGAVRQGHSVNETAFGRIIDEWEWAQIQGIKPYCCDSDFLNSVETVVHGGFDGYVYQQELGSSFNGSNISAVYTTAPLPFDDVELRKLMQKLDIFYRIEGITSISASFIYDFGNPAVAQPPAIIINEGSGVYVFDGATSLYDTATYSNTRLQPRVISNAQGSGFIIQVSFTSNDTNPSYSLQAFTLSYRPLGRR